MGLKLSRSAPHGHSRRAAPTRTPAPIPQRTGKGKPKSSAASTGRWRWSGPCCRWTGSRGYRRCKTAPPTACRWDVGCRARSNTSDRRRRSGNRDGAPAIGPPERPPYIWSSSRAARRPTSRRCCPRHPAPALHPRR